MIIEIARKADLKNILQFSIRLDLAWELFLPESLSSLPKKGNDINLILISNWLWNTLGNNARRLRKDLPEKQWIIIPALDQPALRFVERIASFWSDEILEYVLRGDGTPFERDAWIPPTVSVFSDKDKEPEEEALTLKEPEGTTSFIMPLLGMGRAFMRTYRIAKGGTYSRLHSHSIVDEYYLLLSGTGSLRVGEKTMIIAPGTMISKPTGPDLTSQFIADRGEELKVLDIEVWPDSTRTSKDFVYYQDHKEVLLRGLGWSDSFPYESITSAKDLDENYDYGYSRNKDGS